MSLTTPTPAGFDDDRRGPALDPRIAEFTREGFLGPLRIFSSEECRQIAAYLYRQGHPAPADWNKGRAVNERFLYDRATRPVLLSVITALLGEDVVLWGVSAVSKRPGANHPWHSDIESSSPDGRFVTVWIGIENTSRESALQMISRSHRLDKTVQELRHERGLPRDAATPEAMLAATQEREPEAALVQPDMTNGDALVFDGRLWHGSANSRQEGRRLALLFQYAAPESPVRIPDLSQLDWPFQSLAAPLPAVILVSGSDRSGVNRRVLAPPLVAEGAPPVITTIHRFNLPVANPAKKWEAFRAFRGPTRSLSDMSCHASVLVGGHSPHPSHAHREEELLIPLHGEVELLIGNGPSDPAPRAERICPGSFVYYPAGQHHTIRNPGTSPVGYLMFKWHAPMSTEATPLGTGIYHIGDVAPSDAAPPPRTSRIFEGPTSCLAKLHAHTTVLEPGAGYDPHVDAYDVAIVALSGSIKTLGQVIEPPGVAYFAAGAPHGMRNVGAGPARYLVIEFHARGGNVSSLETARPGTIGSRVAKLGKRLVAPIWHRLRPYLVRKQ